MIAYLSYVSWPHGGAIIFVKQFSSLRSPRSSATSPSPPLLHNSPPPFLRPCAYRGFAKAQTPGGYLNGDDCLFSSCMKWGPRKNNVDILYICMYIYIYKLTHLVLLTVLSILFSLSLSLCWEGFRCQNGAKKITQATKMEPKG